MKFSVYSETGLQKLIGELRVTFKKSGYVGGNYSDAKPRSLNQNALSHDWYAQIARELGDQTPDDVKCECKLRFGVPIMRNDPDFREMYDSAIKRTMTYEQKLKVMRYLPVTSLMNTAELSAYLEQMQREYAGRVALQFPDEMARAA